MKNLSQIILLLGLLSSELLHPQEVKNFYTIRDSISSKEIINHLKVLACAPFLASKGLCGQAL